MNDNYKIHTDEDGNILCDSCGCEVPTDKFDWPPPNDKIEETKWRYLCEVCATTHIGNETLRPTENYRIAVILAQVANHIKDKLNLF